MAIFEKGRTCVVTQGSDAGRKVTIKSIIDKNFVTISGEHVKERKSNIKHLEPISEISKTAKAKAVKKTEKKIRAKKTKKTKGNKEIKEKKTEKPKKEKKPAAKESVKKAAK